MIECKNPNCGKQNDEQAMTCKVCGYSFAEMHAEELVSAELMISEAPDSAESWIAYAIALYRNRRSGEVAAALDKALPLLAGFCWDSYMRAGWYYSLVGQAQFGRRLMADGILYNLENYREYLDQEEIEDAGVDLLNVARRAAVEEFNAMDPGERAATRQAWEMYKGVSYDDDPCYDLKDLGPYELAVRLASPSDKRLYPGSPLMTTHSSTAVAKRAANKKLIIRIAVAAVVIVVLLWAFSCLLNTCGF